MSDDILTRSVTDPRGERLLEEMARQDLSVLSSADLSQRIETLKSEISRVEAAIAKRGSVSAAADALFKK